MEVVKHVWRTGKVGGKVTVWCERCGMDRPKDGKFGRCHPTRL